MDKKQPIFVNGVSWKRPNDITKQKAPWVKGHMSFHVPRLRAWLDEHQDGDWLNLDLKESRDKVKLYFELNTYKKGEQQKKVEEPVVQLDDEMPLLGDEDINKINSEIDVDEVFNEF